jgi:hypothetical protein
MKAALKKEVKPLTPEDVAHRKGLWEYVDHNAHPWHKQHLRQLLELWHSWNQEYFASQLVIPYILLSEPTAPTVYGCCAPISGFGGRSEIRIRPSLLVGTHPHMRREKDYAEGRFRFVGDVLLHETIHQWQQEVTGETEKGSHGHGKTFRDMANEIGAKLGLTRVRTSKKRGKDEDLPSCAQWPHNVRPPEYYLGAYVPPEGLSTVRTLCNAAEDYACVQRPGALLALCKAAIDYYKSTPKYQRLIAESPSLQVTEGVTIEDLRRTIDSVPTSSDSVIARVR